jgi:hypothetical protein
VAAYRHAEGWQAVVRVGSTGKQVLVVAHTFAKPGQTTLKIPLPAGKWKLVDTLAEKSANLKVTKGNLSWQPKGEWAGMVAWLKK